MADYFHLFNNKQTNKQNIKQLVKDMPLYMGLLIHIENHKMIRYLH